MRKYKKDLKEVICKNLEYPTDSYTNTRTLIMSSSDKLDALYTMLNIPTREFVIYIATADYEYALRNNSYLVAIKHMTMNMKIPVYISDYQVQKLTYSNLILDSMDSTIHKVILEKSPRWIELIMNLQYQVQITFENQEI